jgi:hypothetical protein
MEQNPIVTGMQWQLEVIQQQLAQQEKDRTQDKIEKLEKICRGKTRSKGSKGWKKKS